MAKAPQYLGFHNPSALHDTSSASQPLHASQSLTNAFRRFSNVAGGVAQLAGEHLDKEDKLVATERASAVAVSMQEAMAQAQADWQDDGENFSQAFQPTLNGILARAGEGLSHNQRKHYDSLALRLRQSAESSSVAFNAESRQRHVENTLGDVMQNLGNGTAVNPYSLPEALSLLEASTAGVASKAWLQDAQARLTSIALNVELETNPDGVIKALEANDFKGVPIIDYLEPEDVIKLRRASKASGERLARGNAHTAEQTLNNGLTRIQNGESGSVVLDETFKAVEALVGDKAEQFIMDNMGSLTTGILTNLADLSSSPVQLERFALAIERGLVSGVEFNASPSLDSMQEALGQSTEDVNKYALSVLRELTPQQASQVAKDLRKRIDESTELRRSNSAEWFATYAGVELSGDVSERLVQFNNIWSEHGIPFANRNILTEGEATAYANIANGDGGVEALFDKLGSIATADTPESNEAFNSIISQLRGAGMELQIAMAFQVDGTPLAIHFERGYSAKAVKQVYATKDDESKAVESFFKLHRQVAIAFAGDDPDLRADIIEKMNNHALMALAEGHVSKGQWMRIVQDSMLTPRSERASFGLQVGTRDVKDNLVDPDRVMRAFSHTFNNRERAQGFFDRVAVHNKLTKSTLSHSVAGSLRRGHYEVLQAPNGQNGFMLYINGSPVIGDERAPIVIPYHFVNFEPIDETGYVGGGSDYLVP